MDDPKVRALLEAGRERAALALAQKIERRRQRGWLRPYIASFCYRYWTRGVKLMVWRTWQYVWHGVRSSPMDAQNEIDALRFVARHTTIPVPRVFGCFPWNGCYHVVCSRIAGVALDKAWFRLCDADKEAIFDQLSGHVAQLRGLQTPFGSKICSTTGKLFRDGRLNRPMTTHWMFENEDEMNDSLRGYTDFEQMPVDVQRSHMTRHPICYSHADLQPRNIMVDGSRVTGIVDWEFAGWWPAHWKYLKAKFACPDEATEDFMRYVPRFIPPHDMECEADTYLYRRFWTPA